jgi:NAD(P)-dependent dehydrogenase (short-subunit alcohol dehydrogenase family)
VTDGTTAYNASRYRISVFYDLAKVAVNRLAFSQGHELAAHGATAVAITPGWLRSEMMLENFGSPRRTGATPWIRRGPATACRSPPPTSPSQSRPGTSVRAVAALASDPDRARWNQQSVSSGQLAAEYGFTDVDGSRPDVWRYFEDTGERGLSASPDDYR